jgi:hypothetical protein
MGEAAGGVARVAMRMSLGVEEVVVAAAAVE